MMTSAHTFDGSTNCTCIGRTVSRYLSGRMEGQKIVRRIAPELRQNCARGALRHNRVVRARALDDVAAEAADEADVGLGVDEDLDVEQLAQLGRRVDQDALDEDDLRRPLPFGVVGARVR